MKRPGLRLLVCNECHLFKQLLILLYIGKHYINGCINMFMKNNLYFKIIIPRLSWLRNII